MDDVKRLLSEIENYFGIIQNEEIKEEAKALLLLIRNDLETVAYEGSLLIPKRLTESED